MTAHIDPEGYAPKKVGFVIAGTQKGGTTALYEHLRVHPEICMYSGKETHFFDNDDFFRASSPDYSRYRGAFKPRVSHRLLGEATPIYNIGSQRRHGSARTTPRRNSS